jgi:dGTPase
MIEKNEYKIFSKNAFFSDQSKGREHFEEKCEIRTDFSRDKDRIVHSKAFRRLKHKTQVFISPNNDHYRTRLTHTLEVSQIATTIAKALMLNVDLTEAISLGHDLGHTPFGHMGERALSEFNPHGFNHYKQSIRVVDILEKDGKGLNLTYEVKDGILNHTGDMIANTFEGQIIKFADRIAYLNHDIDDAIRASLLKVEDIPKKYLDTLGYTHSERINTLILDLINYTHKENKVGMTKEIEDAMMGLREFLFDSVYKLVAEEEEKVKSVIEKTYAYYLKNTHKLPLEFKNLLKNYDNHTVVCDYIASMTDGYIIGKYNEIFLPKTW